MTRKDVGLRTLLDLSEQVIVVALHAPGGQRILGYDSPHAVRISCCQTSSSRLTRF